MPTKKKSSRVRISNVQQVSGAVRRSLSRSQNRSLAAKKKGGFTKVAEAALAEVLENDKHNNNRDAAARLGCDESTIRRMRKRQQERRPLNGEPRLNHRLLK